MKYGTEPTTAVLSTIPCQLFSVYQDLPNGMEAEVNQMQYLPTIRYTIIFQCFPAQYLVLPHGSKCFPTQSSGFPRFPDNPDANLCHLTVSVYLPSTHLKQIMQTWLQQQGTV